MTTFKDNKVAGGISRDVVVDNEKKGDIYISDEPFSLGFQTHLVISPYKTKYFKTIKGAIKYIERKGKKFVSLTKALNNHFGCEYVK